MPLKRRKSRKALVKKTRRKPRKSKRTKRKTKRTKRTKSRRRTKRRRRRKQRGGEDVNDFLSSIDEDKKKKEEEKIFVSASQNPCAEKKNRLGYTSSINCPCRSYDKDGKIPEVHGRGSKFERQRYCRKFRAGKTNQKQWLKNWMDEISQYYKDKKLDDHYWEQWNFLTKFMTDVVDGSLKTKLENKEDIEKLYYALKKDMPHVKEAKAEREEAERKKREADKKRREEYYSPENQKRMEERAKAQLRILRGDDGLTKQQLHDNYVGSTDRRIRESKELREKRGY